VPALIAARWHAGVRRAEAVAQVRSQMSTHVDALKSALDRRLGLLAGFKSFTESRRTPAELYEEFPLYASGTLAGNPGVQLMQFGVGSVIVAVWPLAGNEHLINFDLGQLDAANLAYLATGRALVTGPVELREGGIGVLLRRRLDAGPGFPELATMILNVPSLIAEGGVPDSASGLRLELRRADGRWFGGDPAGSAVEPEVVQVSPGVVDWELHAAPAAGWATLTAGRARAFHLAAGSLVAMSAFLGFLIGGREERLVREVAASGTRLDLALRAGRMGFWEWDLAANRVACGDVVRQILGFDPSAVPDPDKRFFDKLHPDDRETVQRTLGATQRGERVGNVLECRVMRPDGSFRWVVAISAAERDETGRTVRVFGVLTDATERRELEDRLRHSQRLEAVGKLAGGISHDFNNLLTAMIGFGELAHDQAAKMSDDPRAEAIRDDLAQVLATANRAATLTGQLLAFSRRGTTQPTEVDVSAAVRELEPMLGRLLVGAVELSCTLADDLPTVWVDSGQLTQVVLNLVVNARDAMPDGGCIAIRTALVPAAGARPPEAPPGEWVLLEVADTGTGIAAEIQGRIFEPYFTTKEMGRGTGLGLAVVYGAVEHAGGRVTLASTLGKGTTFRVFLPTGASVLPHDRPAP